MSQPRKPLQYKRVRVTYQSAPGHSRIARPEGIALQGAPVREASSVFLNDLMRAQLRLAGACLVGCIVVSLMLTAGIILLDLDGDLELFGVPASWLLQAYGFYPVILFFSVIFARLAARNERRFRESIAVGDTRSEAWQ